MAQQNRQELKLHLNMSKNFFAEGAGKDCAQSPCLEIFQSHLDSILCHVPLLLLFHLTQCSCGKQVDDAALPALC